MDSMHILHIADTLGPTGLARRMAILLPRLATRGVVQSIIPLDRADHFAKPIREAGITIIPDRPRSAWDVFGLARMRTSMRSLHPDVIMCWGPRGSRMMMRFMLLNRIVRFTDARLLSTQAGARSPLSIVKIPPLVDLVAPIDRQSIRYEFSIPPGARLIVAGDSLTNSATGKLLAWAMDLLKHTSPMWQLAILGDGPARAEVERYTRKLAQFDDRVRFVGRTHRVADWLGCADLFWSTAATGGTQFAIEALTIGVPVMARQSNVNIAAIIEPGITGDLAESAHDYASRTQSLFRNPEARSNMCAAAQASGQRLIVSPDDVAERFVAEWCRPTR
jgi:glycosyltransferase involved in cell wall biosynthesis